MEERTPADRWVVTQQVSPYSVRIARACSLARELSGLAGIEFAKEASEVLKREVTALGVRLVERGSVMPSVDYLVACGVISGTLISILLGELDVDEDALSRMEGSVAALAGA